MKLRSFSIALTAIILAVGVATAVQAVTSKLTSNNNLRLYGYALNPEGYFTVKDNLLVTGNTTLHGSADMQGDLYSSKDVVTVNDDLFVRGLLSINSMPTPPNDNCSSPGGISYDANYLYVCTDGHWKRITLDSF